MTDEAGTKNWLQTLPGLLTAIAAVVAAIGTLVAALSGFFSKSPPQNNPPTVQDCISGYVWREAYPGDHVCVTLETHLRTLNDNQLAASRRRPGGGPYGLDTCETGFVWRETFKDDHVCVTPEMRDQVRSDNSQAALRVKR